MVKIRTLGRTLNHRAGDILAYFDRRGTSNGPIEATWGTYAVPLSASVNLTNYIARSLLQTGGFKPGAYTLR